MMSSSLIYSDCYGEVSKMKKDGSIYLVKIIKSENLKYRDQIETLNAMKKLLLNMNPNLSEYIDYYFNENGDFEILMEYDEDSEYELKINYNKENNRTFEEDYIWSLTIQLFKLLKYIQQNKDIKIEINPAKILLMNNGTLKVFDYGLDLISNMGLSSSILQKINYITPPEYIKEENKIIDEDASNIWKAGCIIYELCTLKRVFEFESMFDMEVKLSQFKGNYEINIDNNKYSEDFKILLSKMLIAEPEKRANIDELLNCEIIKKRIESLKEKDNLEKKLLKASIFTFKQSLMKSSVKDSLRQIQNQNEMMENDNYEILKFSLSNNKEPKRDSNIFDKNVDYLKQTGFFGGGEEKQNVKKKDFKELLLEEKSRKENENFKIIDNNEDFFYNNPFRMNINLQSNDNMNVINKQKEKKNEINKIKIDNFIQKERDRTPLCENKNKRYFLDVDKNINTNKNRSKPKKNNNNRSKDILPKINPPFVPNKMVNSKDIKKTNKPNNNFKNTMDNNNNLVEKTEQILKLFKVKKGKKLDDTNPKIKKPVNNNKLASMSNAQIDAILNDILHKQNVNLMNKIQKNANMLNNNNNNNIKNLMNKPPENKIKLKAIPQNKPLKNFQTV